MKENEQLSNPLNGEKKKRKKILLTVCIALMAVIASVSGLNVAQPNLAVDFNVSQGTVLWMINIYTISLAALLLPLGALGDRIGRKRALVAGLIIFGIASAASGLATSSFMMLAARLISGIGAALIMPVTLAVITSTFPEEERSNAIGVWTGVAGGGGIMGMYLSAVLLDLADWRWLFVLPVTLALIAIVMTLRHISDYAKKTAHRFDIIGSLLSIIGIIGIVYALHEVPGSGWMAPGTIISLFAGVAGLTGFVFWELQQPAPLLDLHLFRTASLSSGSVCLLILFGVQAGIFIVLFPFFQNVLGWSGLRSTLGMMPMAVLMMAASALAPKLSKQISIRYTMACGIIIATTGAILMAILVSATGGYLNILPGMLAMGAGMGLTMTPSTEAITSSLPSGNQGIASALNDVTRELGTALGVALLGALVTAGYNSSINHKLNQMPAGTAIAARKGIASALAAAPDAGAYSSSLVLTAKESFVYGWQQAMWTGVMLLTALLVYILVRGPRK